MDGFTAVRCTACAHMPSGFEDGAAALPGVDEVLLEGLRAVVRDSRHGMLVSSGCAFAAPGRETVCAAREPGMIVLVQACDAESEEGPGRAPLGPVVVAGPVRSTEDVRAVTRWLARGRFDVEELPARLRGPRRRVPSGTE